MDEDRRNSPRLRQYFEVEYLIRNMFGADALVTAATLDISATGMRLGMTRRLPKSQRFVECRITIGGHSLKVLVEIMWRSDTAMGVRFVNPPPVLKFELAEMQKRQRTATRPESRTIEKPKTEQPKQSKSPSHHQPPPLQLSRILQDIEPPAPPKKPTPPVPYDPTDLQKKWVNKATPQGDLSKKWLNRRQFIEPDEE